MTIGEEEDPYQMDGEQKLFHLSKKTVADLVKLAAEAEVTRGEDVFVKGGPNRFTKAPALCYLEQNLFRYQYEPYTEKQCEIRMFEALSPREEVHQTALYIRKLIREEGLTYRDIAVGSSEIWRGMLPMWRRIRAAGDSLFSGPDQGDCLKSHDRIHQKRLAVIYQGFFV